MAQAVHTARSRGVSHAIVFLTLLAILAATHLHYLSLPFFWDELGQFVPAALDILRDGAWVPHSTVPNVHPPGVMAYLALVWRITGYSVAATRAAMLVLAALGLYAGFLLTIRMCREVPGAPAFSVALLMLATPLFYTQAMMAQLDMPAMVFTVLALWLFLEGRIVAAALASTALVLAKETGLILPALLAAWMIVRERRWRESLWFLLPPAALAVWLVILKNATGEWLGDPGFAHYNVAYSLSPVRSAAALVRRLYFLFIADFRWIGTLAIVYGLRRTRHFFTPEWALLGLFSAAHILLVSLLGGATLERYLLPVMPVLYIAVATGLSVFPGTRRRVLLVALIIGLTAGLFWNSPYPFPLENNLAMVDFVELQKDAATFLDRSPRDPVIATAWPYTAALYNPDLKFVTRRHRVVETNDFHRSNVLQAVERGSADILVIYSRTWEPEWSLLRMRWIEDFLRSYYDYEPQISGAEIEERLGMRRRLRFSQGGQWIEVYSRP